MHAAVVSLFPELVAMSLDVGVTARAMRSGLLSCELINPRDYASDERNSVDDRPFGGGPGMVMMFEPLRCATEEAKAELPAHSPVIGLSPQGERFDQRLAEELAALPGFVLVAARYEGVDERFLASEVDRELSIGDYVLTGGELAAMVVIDAVTRLLPGALGNPQSALAESYEGGLLDWPQYTRPDVAGGVAVPPVLLSGDHGAVARWRRQEALRRTWQRRPDLLLERPLDAADRKLLADCLAEERATAT